MKNVLVLVLLFVSNILMAQSPIGVWKTIDDKTGQPKSQIQLTVKDGQYSGKVIKLLRADADPNRRCTECTDARKGQLILGMEIVRGLKPVGKEWKGGKILDPENGTEYGCTIWFEAGKPDELNVRGYHWTGIYRTQKWYRVK